MPFSPLFSVDGRNPFAPPKKPWLKPLFVSIYRESDYDRLLRWCRISSIHSMKYMGHGS